MIEEQPDQAKNTWRSPAGNRTQGLANSSSSLSYEATTGTACACVARPWVRFPAGLRCIFSPDPAVSSSLFVGAEREENLIRNDSDKS